jgi:hypothetical protein
MTINIFFSSSQSIEDMKHTIEELNGKFNSRQQIVDQLNGEITQLKKKLEQAEIRTQQFQVYNSFEIYSIIPVLAVFSLSMIHP